MGSGIPNPPLAPHHSSRLRRSIAARRSLLLFAMPCAALLAILSIGPWNRTSFETHERPSELLYLSTEDGLKGQATLHSISMDDPAHPITRLSDTSSIPWGVGRYSADGQAVLIRSGFGRHWLVSAQTGRVEPLFRQESGPLGLSFDWSLDGRSVLLRADENCADPGLWLVDLLKGDHRTLLAAREGPEVLGAAVSPDGRRVAYSTRSSGSVDLWAVETDGDRPQHLYSSSFPIHSLSWSPDGHLLAFLERGSLGVFEVEERKAHVLARDARVGYSDLPAWSPDSRLLAYVRAAATHGVKPTETHPDPAESVFDGARVAIVDAEDGAVSTVEEGGSRGDLDPTWSPSGRRLAFVSKTETSTEIRTARPDGSEVQTVASMNGFVRYLHWRALGLHSPVRTEVHDAGSNGG